MHTPRVVVAPRAIAVGLIALSLLAACHDDPAAPTKDPPPPAVAQVTFCAGLEPHWLAFQDGDGAWVRAQPSTEGGRIVFRRTLSANRGGVALARQAAAQLTALAIQYGTPAELAIVGDTIPQHCGAPTVETLTGTVAGLGAGQVGIVSAGFASREAVQAAEDHDFELRGLLPGPQEILAVRAMSGTGTLSSMILRRTPALPDGAAIPVLDFDSPEAFQPVPGVLTLAGRGTDEVIGITSLRTAHSQNVVTFLAGDARATTRPFAGLPASRLEAGEMQSVTVTATPTAANAVRSATLFFRAPGALTLAFGAPSDPPTVDVAAAAPTLRLRARFAPQADYDRQVAIAFQQGQNTTVSVAMTAAYAALNGAGYELTVPELSAVQGFDSHWALRGGEPVFWSSSRIGGTLGLGANAVPDDGATSRLGVVNGALTP